MTTAIQAIETSYAGCRFRSRLEARWAVFFDTLGIEWQYEPQGYTVGPDGVAYLPDFWLPFLKVWVEVKGALTAEELRLLIFAASGAGLPVGGPAAEPQRVSGYEGRILVLGDIPQPTPFTRVHTMFSAIGDIVVKENVFFLPFPGAKTATVFAIGSPSPLNQFVAGEMPDVDFLSRLNHGREMPFVTPMPAVDSAYRAARSARFERGESG